VPEPAFRSAVSDAADPAAALLAAERLAELHGDAGRAILADPGRARGLVALAAASRSLTEAVLRDPRALDPAGEPAAGPELDGPAFLASAADLRDPLALRRWKQRQIVRIALRDLLGGADLPSVGRELSALAETCLQVALRLAEPAVPLTVIGMGKLGGEELNYASDVDVLFVHDGDDEAAEPAAAAARRLLQIMSEPSEAGIVFRTDADLRPEGRSGALSRRVAAYEDYYRSWAGHWEHQALIKARRVAGDVGLANRFFDAVQPLLWDRPLDPDALREIRGLKARTEALRATEIKRGPGGIRDVEFAIQLLQLVHGRHDRTVRSNNTLVALEQLARAGYVAAADADHLGTAYRYLRTVEHRLQLRDEQQVYSLPDDAAALTRLARVMGYRDTAAAPALEQFESTHRRHLASVRSIFERLFFRPLLDALAGRSGPLDDERLGEQLAALGFRDSGATRAAVAELTAGMSRNATQFRTLFPLLLEWLSATPDPDLGLLQLRSVADGPVRANAVVGALRDSAAAGERLCRLLGSSKLVGRSLRRHPEALADLVGDTALAEPLATGALLEEATEALQWRSGSVEHRREGLRRFVRRVQLRIACRDLLGLLDGTAAGPELTALAEASLAAALAALAPPFPFAVIGLGKLGGAELGYGSDLDVVFVHGGDAYEAEQVAATLLRDLSEQTAEGQAWDIDARLRPEGRSGALALSLDGYRSYWATRAELWERQAYLRARPVAGDADLGARFCAWRDEVVYGVPLRSEEVGSIRALQQRVQRERVKAGEDAAFHLKLGPGGLVSVEWSVQLQQLRHGAASPAVRLPGTLAALAALTAAGLVDGHDAAALEASYRFCERARNAARLHRGSGGDSLPTDPREAAHLGRLMGFDTSPEPKLRARYTELTRQAAEVADRLAARLAAQEVT
jgi:glutamate-ammonia-ligase adenylyltransferase